MGLLFSVKRQSIEMTRLQWFFLSEKFIFYLKKSSKHDKGTSQVMAVPASTQTQVDKRNTKI